MSSGFISIPVESEVEGDRISHFSPCWLSPALGYLPSALPGFASVRRHMVKGMEKSLHATGEGGARHVCRLVQSAAHLPERREPF